MTKQFSIHQVRSWAVIMMLSLVALSASAQQKTPPVNPGKPTAAPSPEDVVREFYQLLTISPSTAPERGKVRELCVPEAVFAQRTSPTEISVLSLDGFVKYFEDLTARERVKDKGLTKTAVHLKTWMMGDVAQILVNYRITLPSQPRAAVVGVDNILLVRRGGRWLILAVGNEIPTPGLGLPDEP